MHPILAGILAGGLTILAACALWRLVRTNVPSRSPSVSIPAMIGVSFLAFGICAVTTLVYEGYLVRRGEPVRLAQRVCKGETLPDSPAYSGDPPHPILFVSGGDSVHLDEDTIVEMAAISSQGTDEVASEWNDQVPTEWAAHGTEGMQLVGCLTEQLTEVEVCRYAGGPDITRYRRDLAVRLMEARTGRLIGEQTFDGSQPRSCRAIEDIDLVMLIGNPVTLASAQPWLDQFVQNE